MSSYWRGVFSGMLVGPWFFLFRAPGAIIKSEDSYAWLVHLLTWVAAGLLVWALFELLAYLARHVRVRWQ